MKTKLIATSLVILGLATVAFAAEDAAAKLPPASKQKEVTFDKDIKPIFEKSCTKCHGAERAKAKLRLDSAEAALKGSENGKVIEAGKSDKSSLVLSVAHIGDPETFMPPTKGKGKPAAPLTAEQVGLIRAWIDQGAK
jgi:mono/diheme cytochrome c family protein